MYKMLKSKGDFQKFANVFQFNDFFVPVSCEWVFQNVELLLIAARHVCLPVRSSDFDISSSCRNVSSFSLPVIERTQISPNRVGYFRTCLSSNWGEMASVPLHTCVALLKQVPHSCHCQEFGNAWLLQLHLSLSARGCDMGTSRFAFATSLLE